MVASDEVFNSIGIDEDNVHFYCCDDQAFDVLFSFFLFIYRMVTVLTIIDYGYVVIRKITILPILLNLSNYYFFIY